MGSGHFTLNKICSVKGGDTYPREGHECHC